MRLSVDVVEGPCFLLFSLCLGVEGDQSHTGSDNLRFVFVGDRRWVAIADSPIREISRPPISESQVLVWAVRIQGMSFYPPVTGCRRTSSASACHHGLSGSASAPRPSAPAMAARCPLPTASSFRLNRIMFVERCGAVASRVPPPEPTCSAPAPRPSPPPAAAPPLASRPCAWP